MLARGESRVSEERRAPGEGGGLGGTRGLPGPRGAADPVGVAGSPRARHASRMRLTLSHCTPLKPLVRRADSLLCRTYGGGGGSGGGSRFLAQGGVGGGCDVGGVAGA